MNDGRIRRCTVAVPLFQNPTWTPQSLQFKRSPVLTGHFWSGLNEFISTGVCLIWIVTSSHLLSSTFYNEIRCQSTSPTLYRNLPPTIYTSVVKIFEDILWNIRDLKGFTMQRKSGCFLKVGGGRQELGWQFTRWNFAFLNFTPFFYAP